MNKKSIPEPDKLIEQADTPEGRGSTKPPTDYSTRLYHYLEPMSAAEKIQYLEPMVKTFRQNDKNDEIRRAMTPISTTDVHQRLYDFEQEHGKKPNQRDKNRIFEEAEKAIELHTEEYYKLKSKAEKWYSDLQDKTISKVSNLENSNEKGSKIKKFAKGYDSDASWETIAFGVSVYEENKNAIKRKRNIFKKADNKSDAPEEWKTIPEPRRYLWLREWEKFIENC